MEGLFPGSCLLLLILVHRPFRGAIGLFIYFSSGIEFLPDIFFFVEFILIIAGTHDLKLDLARVCLTARARALTSSTIRRLATFLSNAVLSWAAE